MGEKEGERERRWWVGLGIKEIAVSLLCIVNCSHFVC